MAHTIYSDPPSGPGLGRVHPTMPGSRMTKAWEFRREDEDDEKRALVVDEILARRKARLNGKATAEVYPNYCG